MYIGKLFHLYKNPVYIDKTAGYGYKLIDEVRQRFAAYYPGRKTQQERSATTVSAGVMGTEVFP